MENGYCVNWPNSTTATEEICVISTRTQLPNCPSGKELSKLAYDKKNYAVSERKDVSFPILASPSGDLLEG